MPMLITTLMPFVAYSGECGGAVCAQYWLCLRAHLFGHLHSVEAVFLEPSICCCPVEAAPLALAHCGILYAHRIPRAPPGETHSTSMGCVGMDCELSVCSGSAFPTPAGSALCAAQCPLHDTGAGVLGGYPCARLPTPAPVQLVNYR